MDALAARFRRRFGTARERPRPAMRARGSRQSFDAEGGFLGGCDYGNRLAERGEPSFLLMKCVKFDF
jgi:hypothetical protein